jgi:DNA-binding MarR family transcriptional regulator
MANRRLLFLMHQAHRALTAVLVAELGVSSAQLATMYHVGKHPGCSMTDVATLFGLNKSAASGMVQRLERAELLRREPNPADGRASLLFVTTKGESVRSQSLAVVRRLTGDLTDGFSEAEMDTVFRFLNNIVGRCAGNGEGRDP